MYFQYSPTPSVSVIARPSQSTPVSAGRALGNAAPAQSDKAAPLPAAPQASPPLSPPGNPRQLGSPVPANGEGHLFGDWGGLRRRMIDAGFTPSIRYVGEGITGVNGVPGAHAVYVDQLSIGVAADLKKITGVIPGMFSASIVRRHGDDFNSVAGLRQLVDPVEVVGRGEIWRPNQLWYRVSMRELEFKLGRIALNEDFNSDQCDFLSGYFCGSRNVRLAGFAWFANPVSSWGGLVKYSVGKKGYLQVGVFNVNPRDIDVTNELYYGWKGGTGVNVPIEAAITPNLGSRLPGIYKVGMFYTNADTGDPVVDRNGGARLLTGAPGRIRKGEIGVWLNVRQQLVLPRTDGSHGLSVSVAASRFSRKAANQESLAAATLAYTGPLPGRPRDELAFGIGTARVNNRITQSAQMLADRGISAIAVRTREYSMEAYYGVQIAPGLVFRPDIQFTVHPSGDHSRQNAVLAGFKAAITL